jgi:hypothetical protein
LNNEMLWVCVCQKKNRGMLGKEIINVVGYLKRAL